MSANPDRMLSDLTGFQRDLLRTVAAHSGENGTAIKTALESQYGHEVNVNHGRLYPNLDRLAENGLVEKGEIDNRANAYSLTERGRALLGATQAWTKTALEGDEK